MVCARFGLVEKYNYVSTSNMVIKGEVHNIYEIHIQY